MLCRKHTQTSTCAVPLLSTLIVNICPLSFFSFSVTYDLFGNCDVTDQLVRQLQWWHPEALWFANISNMILWFTYVKGAWRALSGKFGAGITFKTTLKGAGRLLDSVLTDLWMPTLCFILSAVSLGVGIHKLVSLMLCLMLCLILLCLMLCLKTSQQHMPHFAETQQSWLANYGNHAKLCCCEVLDIRHSIRHFSACKH